MFSKEVTQALLDRYRSLVQRDIAFLYSNEIDRAVERILAKRAKHELERWQLFAKARQGMTE